MIGWNTKTIGELCDAGGGKVQTGPFGSQLHESDYSETGIPVVMPKDILDSRIDETAIARVSESHVDRLRRHKLSKGDIIYGRRGDIGRQALIRDENVGWLCGTGCLRISLGKSSVIPEFLHRYLQLSNVIQWIEGQAIGATLPNLNTNILRRVPVIFPAKRATQQKIAAILYGYDELIENNNRRIALLEKLAQETYREWFVRFRFPGHEKTKLVKGVPTDWEIRKISDVVDFLSGYSFKSETYTPAGKFGIVTIRNVQDGYFVPDCTDFIDEPPANMKQHCVLNSGDVLMSLTGNVGRVCRVYGSNLLLNQRVAKLESKLKNGSQFLYYTFNNRSMIQLIENLSLGSTAQMNLSPIQLGKQKLVVPDSEPLLRFENAVQPLAKLSLNLHYQCENLTIARNRLLPRLISGKLSVVNLNIHFPAGMAEGLNAEPSAVHA